jgi:asparagine synthase (glutamine-hydrolysing)
MAVTLLCGAVFGTGAGERLETMIAALRFLPGAAVSIARSGHAALATVTLAPAGRATRPRSILQGADGSLLADDDPDALADAEDHAREIAPVVAALRSGRWPSVPCPEERAIACWSPADDALFLARDPIGVSPLFHARAADGMLLFASHPAALIASGAVTRRKDHAVLAGTALGARAGEEATIFAGIRRVLPGHVLRAGPEGGVSRRAWRLPVRLDRTIGAEDAARSLRAHLEHAVGARVGGTGPVFTHLSGGLDSPAIAALAARADPGRVTGLAFPTPAARRDLGAPDEMPYARAVAQQAGLRLVEVPGDHFAASIEASIDPFLPEAAGALNPENALLATIAEGGGDIVLCGFGGDEGASFDGAGATLDDLARLRLAAIAARAGAEGRPAIRGALAEIVDLALPPRHGASIRSALGRPRPPGNDFARFVRARWRGDDPFPGVASSAALRRALIETGTFVERLEQQAMRAARHGLRYTYPMLDIRLLTFVSSLPGGLFRSGAERRSLFRRATADLLPESVLGLRRKLMPDPTGLVALAERREAVRAILARIGGHPDVAPVFDVTEMAAAIDRVPTPAEAAARIREAAREGAQVSARELDLLWPLTVARFAAGDDVAIPDDA